MVRKVVFDILLSQSILLRRVIFGTEEVLRCLEEEKKIAMSFWQEEGKMAVLLLLLAVLLWYTVLHTTLEVGFLV